MKRLGLRGKFILLISFLLLTLFAALAFILLETNIATLKQNLFNESKAFASLATKPIGDVFIVFKDSGRIKILQQVEKFTDLDSNVSNVEIVGVDGKIIFSQYPDRARAIDQESATSFEPIYVRDSAGNLNRVIYPYIEDFGLHRYTVVYEISDASIRKNIADVVESILVFSLAGLLLSALIIFIMVNRLFIGPIRDVSSASLAISRGELGRQIKVDTQDEIGDLADAVNRMATSLKADIKKLKELDELKSEFMMIASHNLRTPLTVMALYLDKIISLKPRAEVEKLIRVIMASNSRLNILASDLLTISSIEAGEYVAQKEITDLVPLIQSIAAEFSVLAKEKGINFKTDILVKKAVLGLSRDFRSAVWNLLDNALKFTAPGGEIKLSLNKTDGIIKISVEDTGVGIAKHEMRKLFTKFHRGTSTLEYNYEGVGIGLYITKLIVAQLGGEIKVSSRVKKGSTFTIELPSGKNSIL